MVAENIQQVKATLKEGVCLLAVSKTKSNEMILEAYEQGLRDFGENKVQELTRKFEELPKDIRWHFIGHLQSNKVKYIAPFVYLIHGVDSIKLLQTIDKEAKKNNRIIPCLLQIKIANEETKFGISPDEITSLIESNAFLALQNIAIAGIMGMASNTDSDEQVKNEFNNLKHLFDLLKTKYFQNDTFQVLSMGMSGDYGIAMECGSTMVRLGSIIFGERHYSQ